MNAKTAGREVKENLMKQMTNFSLFVGLDKIMKDMNNHIKEKVEIKTTQDIERVADKINESFKSVLALIDASKEFDGEAIKIIRNTCILDFHIRMAEENKIDLFQMLDILGPFHTREFSKAQDNNPFG
jgi:hypothetical protein